MTVQTSNDDLHQATRGAMTNICNLRCAPCHLCNAYQIPMAECDSHARAASNLTIISCTLGFELHFNYFVVHLFPCETPHHKTFVVETNT
jgi:hypothetical protein